MASLSVLMPCYNAANFIESSIQSLQAQVFDDFVLHVFDDGSTDNSTEIVAALAKQDKRIRLHLSEQNLGIMGARNALLTLCETELACWADADDIYHPQRLARQVALMSERPEVGVCSTDFIAFSETTRRRVSIPHQWLEYEYLLFYNHVLNPGAMFRMSLVKAHHIRFDPAVSGASDYRFWSELMRHTEFAQINEPLVEYRVHSDQESTAQAHRQMRGHCETVAANLARHNVFLSPEQVARLLVFPVERVGGALSQNELRQAGKLLTNLKRNIRGVDAKKIRFSYLSLVRAHCKRRGLPGLFLFLRMAGIYGLKHSERFGLTLLKDMLQQSVSNLSGRASEHG